MLGSDREVCIRELVDMLDIHYETVRRTLANMERAGYLTCRSSVSPTNGCERFEYWVSNQRGLERFFNNEPR